ncbi:MAG: transposase family protein [Mesorhizobium sp.]|nr:MAG: transposase family protein [Mesorhizobium sp.]
MIGGRHGVSGCLRRGSDPRDLTAQHPLPQILFVALAAVLCGATHCTRWSCRNRLDLSRQFIPLERGAPSHDTFSRAMAAVDSVALNDAFVRFMAAFGAQARIDTPKARSPSTARASDASMPRAARICRRWR